MENGDFPPTLLGSAVRQHPEFDPARKRLVAAGSDGYQHIELRPVVQITLFQHRTAYRSQPSAHPGAPAPDALSGHFDDAIGREQVAHIVPHHPVGVEAVHRLQIADAVFIVQPVNALLQLRQRCGGDGGGAGSGRDRDARRSGVVVIGHDRQFIIAPVEPAFSSRPIKLREIMQGRDFPHAVFAHVIVLEYPAFEARICPAAVQDHHVPAGLGGFAVHRQVHDGVFDQHGGQRNPVWPFAPAAVSGAQEGGDGIGTADCLAQRHLPIEHEAAAIREQRAHFGPQAELRVLGIGPLECFDRANALNSVNFVRKHVNFGLGRRWHTEAQGKHADQGRKQVSQRSLQGSERGHGAAAARSATPSTMNRRLCAER